VEAQLCGATARYNRGFTLIDIFISPQFSLMRTSCLLFLKENKTSRNTASRKLKESLKVGQEPIECKLQKAGSRLVISLITFTKHIKR
jgi:hypothetical protein